ncbi:hypothetical protein CAPTEDRAFT_229046 [Capitella teleta]|uniref:C2 domain-containing protein n=1 Tax=Capitella teleta TaxID=283909 RepID=R7UHE8_CAPTE|nr:hypothetical protein CAPTEDRAFT_229046 [Capitella teleta]|eukprot:ELU05508.1 hypothetical protein CAPTEDRAFT_229046 [Capitella teleta]
MSSKDIASTLRHADLPSQQRRLRHLRTVAVRNLAVPNSLQGSHVNNLETLFTLHTEINAKAFYTSEVITGSLNPTWRSFSLAHCPSNNSIDLAAKVVVLKIWQGTNGSHSVCLCWNIHLSGLVFLGSKRDEMTYTLNSLIFGMLDGSYGCPPQSTRAEREMRLMRVGMIRSDLNWRMIELQKLKEKYEVKQSAGHQKDVTLKTKFETLQKDKNRLHEKKKGYFDVREELIKTGAHLVVKRKRLIAELSYIYPITLMSDKVHAISNVRLPNSEDFAGGYYFAIGHDDTMIAVALGFTSHLVMMISHFLDVPLRYPMEHRGSRSQIQDLVMGKLTDKERDFPLFSKGQDKFQFSYGVFLLNKNIAQLRYYCGLGTTDLRVTLANIKSLLELRLGSKFDPSMSHSQLAALFGHQSIPPNLGGPQKTSPPSFNQQTRLIMDNASSPNSSDISSLSSNSDRGGLPRDSKSDPCLKDSETSPKDKTNDSVRNTSYSRAWLQPASSVASSLSADAIHEQWDTPPIGTFKTAALNPDRRLHSNYQLSEEADNSSEAATFRLPCVVDSTDSRSEEILVSDS